MKNYKYNDELDLTVKNSLSLIIGRIKPNSTILEFGPASGRMTKYLFEQLNCKIYCVEIDKDSAKDASKYAEDIIVGDAENYDWLDVFKNIEFDYIIFADVLEHLYYPDRVLKKSTLLLAEEGCVLISLPNIAHNAIILDLIDDQFIYRDTGLLDKTHIRFFTKKTIEKLIEYSELNICYQSAVYIHPSQSEFHNDYDLNSNPLNMQLKERANGEVYQFIIEAKKENCKLESDLNNNEKQILYIDTGSGYSEAEKLVQYSILSDTLILKFNLSSFKNIQEIMFVPLESALEVVIDNIKINDKVCSKYSHSGIEKSASQISFLYDVPKIIIDLKNYKTVNNVEFNFKKIRIINNLKEQQLQEKDNQIQCIKQQLQDKEKEIYKLNEKLEAQLLNKGINKLLPSFFTKEDVLPKDFASQYFDEEGYLEANPIAAEAIRNSLFTTPLIYFKRFGMREIKNGERKLLPHLPLYNDFEYQTMRPDVVSAIQNGTFKHSLFVHYLTHGHKELYPANSIAQISLSEVLNVVNSEPVIKTLHDKIDIVIPVYNGIKYLSSLFDSLFNNADNHYRLIIVNDASPDTSVKAYILDRISNRDDCFYFENERNLGFTETVNYGASKVKSKYFVILNTDVIVPEKWLSRLIAPFYNNNKIASITPFSNSAVYFSYPNMGEDNVLPIDFTLQNTDDAFNRLNPKITTECNVLSGVGFCMAIHKECWDAIGSLDAEAFGRGYGEENDWCMRAAHHGWKNIFCPNLYVYHDHGGSFSNEEKNLLSEKNIKILLDRWPQEMELIEECVKADPWKKYRMAASLMLSQSTKKCVLIMDIEQENGGAFIYKESRVKDFKKENYNVLVLKHPYKSNYWILSLGYGELKDNYKLEHISELISLFDTINIDKILINNLVFLYEQELQTLFHLLKNLKKHKNINIEYVFHDFLAICPSFFLMDNKNEYCALPELSVCKECLLTNENVTIKINSINQWRNRWKEFLSITDNLTCFSNNTNNLIKKIYPDLKLNVKEHKPLVSFTNKFVKPNSDSPLIIGCFGSFDEAKGSKKIIELAKLLKEKYADAKILVFGHTNIEKNNVPDNIHFMGLYSKDELPEIFMKNQISVTFFASIIPETFSYVIQELMLFEAPIVCFNIGAPAERIQILNYKPSCIATKMTAKAVLSCIETITSLTGSLNDNK